uniref:Uncharacterized protein n=1 Tax=Arundo donax TaxID=35708 RepID=A0A0A8Y1B6_ARUDO
MHPKDYNSMPNVTMCNVAYNVTTSSRC